MPNRKWLFLLPALALVLSACAGLAPGIKVSGFPVKAENDVTGVDIRSIDVWKEDGAFVVTGQVLQNGSRAWERGHIHAERVSASGKRETIATAFTDRGYRPNPSLKFARFSLDLDGKASPQDTVLISYHSHG